MMHKKDLLKILGHRIREMEVMVNTFESSKEIHEIEIDLLLSKLRGMYADVKKLSSFDDETSEKEIGREPLPLMETKPPEEEVIVTSQTFIAEPVLEEEVPEKEEPEDVTEPHDDADYMQEEQLDSPIETEQIPEMERQPEPISEPVKEEIVIKDKPSLLEEPKERILSGSKMERVSDIMVAIGLNDRFLFTRELFRNDSGLFKETIEVLNKKQNWEEAVTYLNSKFDWNPQDPSLILFLSFVRRRFI